MKVIGIFIAILIYFSVSTMPLILYSLGSGVVKGIGCILVGIYLGVVGFIVMCKFIEWFNSNLK